MLEQYQKDFSSDSDDALSETRFQMSRRKLVFTLSGATLALLFFLFLVGTFKNDEATPKKKPVTNIATSAIDAKLQEFELRLAKLEKQPATATPSTTTLAIATPTTTTLAAEKFLTADAAFDPEMFEEKIIPISQNSLNNEPVKQLISTDPVQQTPIAPITAPAKSEPAPSAKTAATRTYIVQRGDSLSKISAHFYGTTKHWKEIYNANKERIGNINQLKVGTLLTIPEEP